ncbi:MAG: response regulator transcription factor [Candidatus Hydrogenedentota bacterium]
MRILVVEDSPELAGFVKRSLRKEGHVVETVLDGNEGYHRLRHEHYDAAVMDIMLPGIDGLSIVARLRQENCATPILFLSAKREVEDRVRGLRAGGDDYLVKPFAVAELQARVQSLLRRSAGASEPLTLRVGDLDMDLLKHSVHRAGRRIDLKPREFALLEYLLRNAGRVVSRTMIMENVWDYNFDPRTNVVDSNVCRLRNSINDGFDAKLIRTIRGVGYVLEEIP